MHPRPNGYSRSIYNPIISMLTAFEKYLTYNRRFAENTVKSYLFDIKLFLQFFAFKTEELLEGLSSLTREDYRRYLAFRVQEKKIKASSNARSISSIKCFFNFLEKSNFLYNLSASQIIFPKLPKLMPKALNEEEIKEFLSFIEKGTDQQIPPWKKARDTAIIFLLYGLGLRISEALSLNRKDFHKSMQFLKVKGKGGKERSVPILSIVKEKIEEYIKLSKVPLLQEYPLFITEKRDVKTGKPTRILAREVQKMVQNLRMKLSLPSFLTPHALRHSFATHIIQNGGSIRNVQDLLGHASLSTTQKYVKIDLKTLKGAYLKYYPEGY